MSKSSRYTTSSTISTTKHSKSINTYSFFITPFIGRIVKYKINRNKFSTFPDEFEGSKRNLCEIKTE